MLRRLLVGQRRGCPRPLLELRGRAPPMTQEATADFWLIGILTLTNAGIAVLWR